MSTPGGRLPSSRSQALDAFYGKSQVIFDLNLRVSRGRPWPSSGATARARRPR